MIMSMKDVSSKSGMVALVAQEQDLVLFPENGQGEQGDLPWPCVFFDYPNTNALSVFGLVHPVCNSERFSVLLGQS